jgi:hypothetical protein
MALDLASVVDLRHYPIDSLTRPEGRALVERCHRDLRETAICVLRGFIQAPAVEQLMQDAAPTLKHGHYISEPRMAYEADETGKWPADHPRRQQHDCSYRQVFSYHLRNDGPLRKLFLSPELTEFVRQALGHETLYTAACPALGLTLHAAGEGDRNGWHFDPNDGVVTLMLQRSDSGGDFEYAPYIRNDEEQNYDAVAKLFADPDSRAKRVAIAPGDFVLFNGRFSIHRVAPIGPTTRPRVMAIFSYHHRPDYCFSQSYIDHVRSFPQDAPQLGIRGWM